MDRVGVRAALMVAGVVLAGLPASAADRGTPPREAAFPVTFSRDVAPVLYRHCTECHRPGEIAPMSLLTYEDARPWARSIRDQVSDGRMPPWHADPAVGHFSNERRLTAAERDVLVRWAAAGAPKGDPGDLPPLPRYPAGWTIGQPDAVVRMPQPFPLPADGEIPYQYFEAPTNFTEDHWIQAVEVRPGNRSVVHHVLVFVREPNPAPRELALVPLLVDASGQLLIPDGANLPRPPVLGAGRRGPLLATTAPGMNATILKPGAALLVKAGSVLTFQVHYTPNGTPTSDQTSVGFVFAKQAPTVEVQATAFTNGRLLIPAGVRDQAVESGVRFLADVTVYSLFPHTHLRGKRWDYRLSYPDGRTETILSVPRYDFNWQTDYVFATPLRVPKGSILRAVAHYDNSAANPSNPDPTRDVHWGDQTWEEMQYTGVNFSIDRGAAGATGGPSGR